MCIDRQAAAVGFGDYGLDLRRGLVGRDQVVFELGQPAAHEFQGIAADRRGILATGQVQRLEGALDDPAAVIGVEDVEAGPQAGDLRLDPELARGKAMECAEPGWRGSAVESRPDPAAHFGGGLVGEGDGENTARCDAAGRYAVHDRGG